ncbi:hypothetical protein C456_07412 [Haloferax volcanii DSM 14919]|uniref:Uncharacterized protein n=1 Tax=Haloferax lucentense (strain DSM 14919 / JCM 9276 / NCIMB 13854 / Aa 2.2) TaxID=1230452 RepID=M0GS95_HALL2|nr:hypothetical protein C456_07412 [Haloferax lucentense DSM 14919]
MTDAESAAKPVSSRSSRTPASVNDSPFSTTPAGSSSCVWRMFGRYCSTKTTWSSATATTTTAVASSAQ